MEEQPSDTLSTGAEEQKTGAELPPVDAAQPPAEAEPKGDNPGHIEVAYQGEAPDQIGVTTTPPLEQVQQVSGTDTGEGAVDESKRVEDPDTAYAMALDEAPVVAAHAMALTEDPERTQAAQKRQTAKVARDFTRGENETGDEAVQRVTSELEKIPVIANYMGDGQKEHLAVDVVDIGRSSFNRGDAAAKYERKAKEHDEAAGKLGEWAKVLHDHPIPEAYLREVAGLKEGVELAPKNLVHAESITRRDIEAAELWEGRLAQLEEDHRAGEERYKEKRREIDDQLEVDPRFSMAAALCDNIYEITKDDPEGREEYRAMGSNDNTTVGDLKKLYSKICQGIADGYRLHSGPAAKVLEDIKSGEAAKYQPRAEQAEAA